jgi:hypothetical protein
MGQDALLIVQFQPVQQAGQFLQNLRLYLQGIPYGRVSTQGPSFVTATQCSKWAE